MLIEENKGAREPPVKPRPLQTVEMGEEVEIVGERALWSVTRGDTLPPPTPLLVALSSPLQLSPFHSSLCTAALIIAARMSHSHAACVCLDRHLKHRCGFPGR